MRKLYSLLFVLFVSFSTVNAQGIYKFWGMTEYGGADGIGTIFSTSATGDDFQSKHHFRIITPGAQPKFSELTEYNGKFYSVTNQGGISGSGVIFEWDPTTNVYTKKIDFLNDGQFPNGSLTLSGGKFYGMTEQGGPTNSGVIFEWDPATNIYTKKITFSNNAGRNPKGNLTAYNGKLYGMTENGGSNADGVIF